jgi:hypothetical protein
MDIKMLSTVTTDGRNIWDFEIDSSGCARMITGDEEALQNAEVASFIKVGSTPQLPNAGVDWLGFLTGEIDFGELDSQIRTNISDAGQIDDYVPEYTLENNKLKTIIRKV